MTTPLSAATNGNDHDHSDNDSAFLPRRCIFNDADMEYFRVSPVYADLVKFTQALGQSCSSSPKSHQNGINNANHRYEYDPQTPLTHLSPAMACVHGILTELVTWMDQDFPPSERSSGASFRFGDPVFQQWHKRLVERSSSMVHAVLVQHAATHSQQTTRTSSNDDNNTDNDDRLQKAHQAGRTAAQSTLDITSITDDQDRAAIIEISTYLQAAFGHPIRLDYGTGHESSFHVFLYTLWRIGCWHDTQDGDDPSTPPSTIRMKATTISLYTAYLQVTRQLQTRYMLEPAGSHGVWGLDDFYCLPFYFGACQLQSASALSYELSKPNCIHDSALLDAHKETYLYFGCIAYIQQIKRGVPFFESSPMLHDISQTLPSWSKVAAGLFKLYQGEVLQKRPVVQHFCFGKLFAANWKPTGPAPQEPPTTVFRKNPTTTTAAMPVMGRAPWATGGGGGGPMPPTRALWATNNAPPAHVMPPTRAPWATTKPSTTASTTTSTTSTPKNNAADDKKTSTASSPADKTSP